MTLGPIILQSLKCSSTVEEESALSIYLDIAKALSDTKNHNAILLKLIHFGFNNQLLKFLQINYLIELSAYM